MVVQPLPCVHNEPAARREQWEEMGGHWGGTAVCPGESVSHGKVGRRPLPHAAYPDRGFMGARSTSARIPAAWDRTTVSIWEQEVGGEVGGSTGASPKHSGTGGYGAGSWMLQH